MANTQISLTLATTAVLALAACGGGSSGVSNNPTTTFNATYLSGATIINQFSNNLTTPSAMPVGTASYGGAVLYGNSGLGEPDFGSIYYNRHLEHIKNNPNIVGKVNLTVNFNNNSLTGSITNQSSLTNNASGSISIVGGVISGNSVTASLGGSVGGLGTSSGNVTGSMKGRFHGNNGEAIIGTVSGSSGGDRFTGIISAKQ